MVVYYPCGIDGPLEMTIALVTVELELQSFHVTIVQRICVRNHEEKIRF